MRAQFSPDGSHLVTTSARGVQVWSIDSVGALRSARYFEIENKTPFLAAMADPTQNGKSMLTIANDVILVWRSSFDGQPIQLKGHAGGVRTARFSQDGRWIVSTGIDGTAKLWDATNGGVIATFSGGKISISDAWISADSRRVLTTSGDGIVRIWD